MSRELRPILLVDDNANDIELTLMAFQQAGLANPVDVRRDGAEALEYLRHGTTQPTVILLDLKMPKVDGRELLRHIKNTPELRMIPVVVLTSSRQDADLLQSYDLGANAFVVKPVDFREFIQTVARLGYFWGLVNEPSPSVPCA